MAQTRKSFENDLRYQHIKLSPLDFADFEDFPVIKHKLEFKLLFKNYFNFFDNVTSENVRLFLIQALEHAKINFPENKILISNIQAQLKAISLLQELSFRLNSLQLNPTNTSFFFKGHRYTSHKKLLEGVDELSRNINAVVTTKRRQIAYTDSEYALNLLAEVHKKIELANSLYPNSTFTSLSEHKDDYNLSTEDEYVPPLFWT